jgi:hypothetical protein
MPFNLAERFISAAEKKLASMRSVALSVIANAQGKTAKS